MTPFSSGKDFSSTINMNLSFPCCFQLIKGLLIEIQYIATLIYLIRVNSKKLAAIFLRQTVQFFSLTGDVIRLEREGSSGK